MMKMILGFLEVHKNEPLSSTGPEVLHVHENYYQGECAPCLLVIEDTGGSVFGALLSSPIRWWQHPHRLFFRKKNVLIIHTCHALQRERALLRDGGKFPLHVPASLEPLLLGWRQPGAPTLEDGSDDHS